jgi:hypothetical protein
MFEIERTSWFGRRYAVRDDAGSGSQWTPVRRLSEDLNGEIDGTTYAFRRDGRNRFALTRGETELASAAAVKRGRWAIEIEPGGATGYELVRGRGGRWHMELQRGGTAAGRISRGRSSRGKFVCELPAELDPAVQVFIGLVGMTLWSRASANSGTAAITAGT